MLDAMVYMRAGRNAIAWSAVWPIRYLMNFFYCQTECMFRKEHAHDRECPVPCHLCAVCLRQMKRNVSLFLATLPCVRFAALRRNENEPSPLITNALQIVSAAAVTVMFRIFDIIIIQFV